MGGWLAGSIAQLKASFIITRMRGTIQASTIKSTSRSHVHVHVAKEHSRTSVVYSG